MGKENLFNGSELLNLDQLSKIAGGAASGTDELPKEEVQFLLTCVKGFKNIDWSLERVLEELHTSNINPDKQAQYEAIIKREWNNL